MEKRIPIYGAFLRPESPFYDEYNPKFSERLDELEDVTISFFKVISNDEDNNCILKYLSINRVNTYISVSRYFNDAIRLRTMHDIKRVHRTKIAAYLVKWVNLNPVINVGASFSEINALDEPQKKVLFNINYLFTEFLIRYFIPENEVLDIGKFDEIQSRLTYLMKVGAYEERHAGALLETVDPINGETSI